MVAQRDANSHNTVCIFGYESGQYGKPLDNQFAANRRFDLMNTERLLLVLHSAAICILASSLLCHFFPPPQNTMYRIQRASTAYLGWECPFRWPVSQHTCFICPNSKLTFLNMLRTPSEIFSVVPADCLCPARPRTPSTPLSACQIPICLATDQGSGRLADLPSASCWPVPVAEVPGATELVAPAAVFSPVTDMVGIGYGFMSGLRDLEGLD